MIRRLKGRVRAALPYTAVVAYRRLRFGVRGPAWYRHRAELAARYLRGAGLEIGAQHLPTPLPEGATAEYADLLRDEELRNLHAHHLRVGWKLVPVTVADDAQRLGTVPDAVYDFVIAYHVIEHMEDPLGAVANWLRITKPGGVVMIGVPHRERTFDYKRPGTTLDHVARDYRDGPSWSRDSHLREFAELVLEAKPGEVDAKVARLKERMGAVHFHVWTEKEFELMLNYAHQVLALAFEVIEISELEGVHEFIAVLRRLPGGLASHD